MKELRESILISIIVSAIAIFGMISTALVITKEKNKELDAMAETYNAHLNALLDEKDELIKEIKELEYKASRKRYCSLENVECFDEDNPKWTALVRATWRIETGNGSSVVWNEKNNAGGIMVGSEYKSYPSKEHGLKALEKLLMAYVKDYRYNLKDIRNEYCGSHCGEEDYLTFKQIFNEEMEKMKWKKKILT